MLGILFPSEYEARDLLRSLTNVEKVHLDSLEIHLGQLGGQSVLVAVIGIGAKPSAANTRLILEHCDVDSLILAGFCGALSDQIQRGQVLVAQGYASNDVINFLKLLPDFDVASIYTSEHLVGSAAEKRQLARQTGCQIVDMETSHVAAVASEFGCELLPIRAVSDLAGESIPASLLSAMLNPRTGKPEPARASLALLTHPLQWGAFRRFMAPLPSIRKKLTAFLTAVASELS